MPERFDKFLWFVRLAPTRKAAQEFIIASRPRINRQPTIKPHALIQEGDIITLAFSTKIRVLKIKAIPKQRLSPKQVNHFYKEVESPTN